MEGAFGARRAHFQERYTEPVQGFGRFREQGLRIAVTTPLRIIVGRKPHTRPIRAGYADELLGRLDPQPDTVFDGAAVAIGAPVGSVAQKLIDEIAVRRV